jgi:uncharacterized membrane protein
VKLGVDGSKYKEVFGGGTTSFNLTIQNKGTTADTYDIEAVNSTASWVSLSKLTITLVPEQKTIVTVWVTPLEGAAIGVHDIVINVTSQNDTSTSKEYIFFADVQASYDLFLSTTTTYRQVAAGDDAVFTGVKIENTGNDADTYTFFLTNLSSGWSHDPLSDLNVMPGEIVSFDVTIHTYDASQKGDYEIYLTAISVNDPSKTMTITLYVEVEQVYGLSLTAPTTAKTGDVGETLSYFIEVVNTGNGEDYVELSLTGQHTEFAILYYNTTENGPIIHVRPPAGGSVGIFLNITIPSNYWDIEIQNQFTITVEAESLDDPSTTPVSAQRDFISTVNPVYGVDIISGGFTSGVPGEAISFLFEVKNNGTVTDNYNIGVVSVTTTTGGDTGLWYPEISFNPTSVNNLAKGATQQITMYITIPNPTDLFLVPPGIYNITVELTSAGDVSAKDTQVFMVNVLQVYWADIQNTVIIKNVNIGESVQYSITIKNMGNDYDLLSVELQGDADIPGSVNWGMLTHMGTGQVMQQTLIDIPLNAGESTQILLNITIPERTHPSYPAIDPDDITLTVIVKPSDVDGTDDMVTVTADINIIYEFDFTFLANTINVQPGDPAEFTINVENTGTATETFIYDIYQWDVDWSAYGYTFVPSSGNLQVGAGNIGEVTLTINTPSDLTEALSRDYNIRIKVHSSAGNTDVFKNCTVHIEPVYDVVLTITGSSSKAVNVGSNVTFQFTIQNIGNSPETFQLTATDLDTSSGGGGDQSSWVTFYSVDNPLTPITSITLGAGESKSIIMVIVVPPQGDPGFVELSAPLQIEIEAYSIQDPSASDSFTTTTTVNPVYSFELSTTAPMNTKQGEPGDSVQFTLQVRNTGTATDTYKFRATSVDEAIFSVGTINDIINLGVDSYGSTMATITITSVNDLALVGTYPIEITAESDKDAAVTHSIILYIEITALGEVELTPVSQADSGMPGDVIDYVIKITNKGNADDTFNLSLGGTYKNWAEIYDASGTTQITQVTLSASTMPGYFTDIIIRVTIPGAGETTAGQSYPITVEATSSNTIGVKDTAQVTTTADEYVNLTLQYSGSGPAYLDYDPNKSPPKFTFKVTNHGNTDETSITVNVDNMPTVWGSPTIDIIDILEPGKSATFSVTMNIPSDEDEGEYDMLVSATSSDGSFETDSVSITVNITKPDLTVDSVLGLDDVPYLKGKVGDAVTITAQISNIGHTEAESVQVKLYEDGIVKDTKTISSISPDVYKNVDFRWTVVGEEVEIKVEVTPIEEIDDGNNAIPPIFLDLRPDLSFTGEKLNFSNSKPDSKDKITITAYIYNGGGDAEDVVVNFYYGTKIIGADTIDIDYEEIREASVLWEVPDEPGETLIVKAEIDLSGAIGDGKEATRSLTVKEKPITPEPEPSLELEAIGQLVAFEDKTFTYKVTLSKVDPGANLTFSAHDVTITVTDDKGQTDSIPVKFRVIQGEDEVPDDYTWILFVILAGVIAFIIGYLIKGAGQERFPEEKEEYPGQDEPDMGDEEEWPSEDTIEEEEFKEPPATPPPETPESNPLPPSPPPFQPEEESFEFEKAEEE